MLPIQPPIAPMLAKLQEAIPSGPGWLYEPKWDGFRAIVFRDGEALEVWSRDKRPLLRYFPELQAILLEGLPERCVIDGEIILTGPRGLDFDGLQLRLHPAESRVRMLAEQTPVSFVAFDLLALGDEDLRTTGLASRRSQLEKALAGSGLADMQAAVTPGSRLLLTPQTPDAGLAARWFDEFEEVGLDGIIAKRTDLLYLAGDRAMVKVKHRRTVDCVVGGYRRESASGSLGSLLLGLYDGDGALHYVGHTSSFSAAERRELLDLLKPLEGQESFGFGRTPGGPSRWSGGRSTDWVSVAPELVCEVSFDFLQGPRFRHAARFERWRPDKPPRACTMDQFGRLLRL